MTPKIKTNASQPLIILQTQAPLLLQRYLKLNLIAERPPSL